MATLRSLDLLINTFGLDKDAEANNGATALHYAAANGHPDIVRLLIDAGQLDAKAKDNNGATALHWAAAYGHSEIVRLLIGTYEQDPKAESNNGTMALHLAAAGGYPKTVQLLIDIHKQDPKTKATNGATALHYAAANGHSEVVQLLIGTYEQDPKTKSNKGVTALHEAAAGGHIEVVRFLIGTGQLDPEVKTNDGTTALHYAAANGHPEVVRLLMDSYKKDPSAKDDFEYTVLHEAVRNEQVKVIRLLTGPNADPETKDLALFWAVTRGDIATIRVLLNNGARLEAPTHNKGRTVLHVAASNGDIEVLRLLIGAGADLEAKDKDSGATPLQLAIHNGQKEALPLLLFSSASLESKDHQGQTALHTLCKSFNISDIETLIIEFSGMITREHWQAKDNKGRTPIDILSALRGAGIIGTFLKGWYDPENSGAVALIDTAKAGHEQHVKRLLEAGVNPGATDELGWNALHYAVNNDNRAMVRTLAREANIDALAPPSPAFELVKGSSFTPLHMAIQADNFEMVKLLLEHGASLGIANNWQQTPLHLAMEKYSQVQLKELYYRGIRHLTPELINLPDQRGESPLQILGKRVNTPVRILDLFANHQVARKEDAEICGVCLDKLENTVFQCGHQTCDVCCEQLTGCPICRASIQSRARLF